MSINIQERNLPWIEKYRPAQLDDLISHKDIINTIQKFLSQGRLPHLLFYGPPGSGKTSTILAIAKQLFEPKEFASMVLELNASDDRGIGVVRNEVLSFASTRTIFNKGFKLVILDEADALTKDAQNALRRIIEKFTANVRFCLVCNYLNKIIPAIQSRCTRFRFAPLLGEQMTPRIMHIAEAEHVSLTPDGTQALITLGKGDMRRVLNILQCTSMSFDKVNEDNVYTCVGQPLRSDIKACLQWMLNEEIKVAVNKINQLKILKGLALSDIITELHLLILRLEVPAVARLHVIEQMAEIEMRLSYGASERLQLSALVAAFFQTKEHLLKLKETAEHLNNL